MHIFSEQTFIDMCGEIHVDTSQFNEDTKQSSAICQNPEKPSSLFIVSYQQP